VSMNRYINPTEAILEAVSPPHLSLYSCKCSRRTYTQHQLMTILLLRETLGTDYRDIVGLIDLLDPIKDLLQLEQVPHNSIIHKFMTRVPSLLFTRMLKKTLKLFYSWVRYYPSPPSTPPGSPVPTPVAILLANRKNTRELPEDLDCGGYAQAGDPVLQDNTKTGP
jgi:hypothetical protein